MIWTNFSTRKIGYLHLSEKTVDTKAISKIIRKRVLPYQDQFFDGDNIFQDDSAPDCQSKVTNAFKESNGITSLPRPSNSIDSKPAVDFEEKKSIFIDQAQKVSFLPQ